MNGNNVTQARLQFLSWLQEKHPALFEAAIVQADKTTPVAATLGQNGAEVQQAANDPGFWDRLQNAAIGLGTTYLTLKNQRDAMQLNLERARQGLPPIDAGVTAPVIRTEIDLPPDVVDRVTQSAGIQVNKILLWGGLALAAFYLFQRK